MDAPDEIRGTRRREPGERVEEIYYGCGLTSFTLSVTVTGVVGRTAGVGRVVSVGEKA